MVGGAVDMIDDAWGNIKDARRKEQVEERGGGQTHHEAPKGSVERDQKGGLDRVSGVSTLGRGGRG